MKTISHDSLAWSTSPAHSRQKSGNFRTFGPIDTGRGRIPRPAPRYVSRILTSDSDRPTPPARDGMPVRRLGLYAGLGVAAAALVWAAFAIWQFYDALDRLTIFLRSTSI